MPRLYTPITPVVPRLNGKFFFRYGQWNFVKSQRAFYSPAHELGPQQVIQRRVGPPPQQAIHIPGAGGPMPAQINSLHEQAAFGGGEVRSLYRDRLRLPSDLFMVDEAESYNYESLRRCGLRPFEMPRIILRTYPFRNQYSNYTFIIDSANSISLNMDSEESYLFECDGEVDWNLVEDIIESRQHALKTLQDKNPSREQLFGLLKIAVAVNFVDIIKPLFHKLGRIKSFEYEHYASLLDVAVKYGSRECLEAVLEKLPPNIATTYIIDAFNHICFQDEAQKLECFLERCGDVLPASVLNEHILYCGISDNVKNTILSYDKNPGWNVVRAVRKGDQIVPLRIALYGFPLDVTTEDAISTAFDVAMETRKYSHAQLLFKTGNVSRDVIRRQVRNNFLDSNVMGIKWSLENNMATEVFQGFLKANPGDDVCQFLSTYKDNPYWNIGRAVLFGNAQDLETSIQALIPLVSEDLVDIRKMDNIISASFDESCRKNKPAHIVLFLDKITMSTESQERAFVEAVREKKADTVRVLLEKGNVSERAVIRSFPDFSSSAPKAVQDVQDVFLDTALEKINRYQARNAFRDLARRGDHTRMARIVKERGESLSFEDKADALFFARSPQLANALLFEEPQNDHPEFEWGLAKLIYQGLVSEFLSGIEDIAFNREGEEGQPLLDFNALARLFRYANHQAEIYEDGNHVSEDKIMAGLALTMVIRNEEIDMDQLTIHHAFGREYKGFPFLYNGKLWERIGIVAGVRNKYDLSLEESVQVMKEMPSMQFTFTKLEELSGTFKVNIQDLWQGLRKIYPIVEACHNSRTGNSVSPYDIFLTNRNFLPQETAIHVYRHLVGMPKASVELIQGLFTIAFQSKFGMEVAPRAAIQDMEDSSSGNENWQRLVRQSQALVREIADSIPR